MIAIHTPQLGESIVEATVGVWLKQPGQSVRAGEAVVELETDKINIEVSAPQNGVLTRVLHEAGEIVKPGEVLAELQPGDATDSAAPAAPVSVEIPQTPVIEATPVARRMAAEVGVDLTSVTPSGPGSRITKTDVQTFISQHTPSPISAATPPSPPPADPVAAPNARLEERARMSRRRQTIAKRLLEASQTTAMLTTFNEVDMTEIMDLRKRRREAFKERFGVDLGMMAFFVKASVAGLKAFPMVNAEIQGDEIVYKKYYDIGIAVGATEGLVVPVIRDADQRSFAAIERGIREFAKKAENYSFALDELRGGTFTITNGGVFGSLLSTPILNPPQVGILGMHRIQERPVARNGAVVIRPMMYVALSYDHRLIDGREAVQFLVYIKELLEDPAALLLNE